MKLNNKILYLTTAGIVSTLNPANTNAQTFYQCMPIVCKAGEYKDNNTCKKCPAGTYNPNTGSLTSADCKPCSAGTYSSSAGASSCSTCGAGMYQDKTGQTSCNTCTIEVSLTCSMWYCDDRGLEAHRSNTKNITIKHYTLPKDEDCSVDNLGSAGATCKNSDEKNNNSGYYKIDKKEITLGGQTGGCAILTCNNITGKVSSFKVSSSAIYNN